VAVDGKETPPKVGAGVADASLVSVLVRAGDANKGAVGGLPSAAAAVPAEADVPKPKAAAGAAAGLLSPVPSDGAAVLVAPKEKGAVAGAVVLGLASVPAGALLLPKVDSPNPNPPPVPPTENGAAKVVLAGGAAVVAVVVAAPAGGDPKASGAAGAAVAPNENPLLPPKAAPPKPVLAVVDVVEAPPPPVVVAGGGLPNVKGAAAEGVAPKEKFPAGAGVPPKLKDILVTNTSRLHLRVCSCIEMDRINEMFLTHVCGAAVQRASSKL
jgi:hypothetical protein